MFYNLIKTPALLHVGNDKLTQLDALLAASHLIYSRKILITQRNLYEQYCTELQKNNLSKVLFIEGGNIEDSVSIIATCKDEDALLVAFGGGSVLDVVKYCATKMDKPYITIPSTLSNDAIYSSVSRLVCNGKKTSYGVQPPIGIIVDMNVVRTSPRTLLYSGICDLVSNLSALDDWTLAHQKTGEPINELAYLLARQAALPLLGYRKEDLLSDACLTDLANGLITSGLSMIVSGNTRGTSGAEHLVSHAIDEHYPTRSTLHGLQVGWAHAYIERNYRHASLINDYFDRMGIAEVIREHCGFKETEFTDLIPLARKIRNRYTILNTLEF